MQATEHARPPREAYVGASRPTVGGAFVEPGIEKLFWSVEPIEIKVM